MRLAHELISAHCSRLLRCSLKELGFLRTRKICMLAREDLAVLSVLKIGIWNLKRAERKKYLLP